MDTPKRQVSWLESFPPDIWACIVCYLPGEQLGRMMMTGATFLWQRLKSPHVVKSIKLGRDQILFKSLPRFLNDFPSLDELLFDSLGVEWSDKLALRIDSIPSGIRKLEFRGDWSSLNSVFGTGDEPSNLSQFLPHLTTIEYPYPGSWMPYSPQSLTKLSVYSWYGDSLPSCLLHFCTSFVDLNPEDSFLAPLPQSLESFESWTICGGIPLLLPLLPPSIRRLRLGGSRDESDPISPRILFQQLPKSLTYLVFPQGEEINFEDNPELIAFPSTLTELEILSAFPCSVWHLLPPNLTKLSIAPGWDLEEVATASATFHAGNWNVVDDCGLQRQGESIPFHLLPKSLTKLDLIDHGYLRFCRRPETFNQSVFPPKLTYLAIPVVQLCAEMAKLLPSSITYLDIANLSERICGHLPTGLKTLKSCSTLMSPNLLNLLPKSLALLEIWLYRNAGTRAEKVSKLPEHLIHDKCLSNGFDWTNYSLPSKLTNLEIYGYNEFYYSFMQHQQLPNLLEFKLHHGKGFTDLSIPLLARHLRTLLLTSSSMVSGRSFQYLPRYLTELNLCESKAIFDSDVQHLPRTLKRLFLNNAVSLTELCIADLPPHLKMLWMSCNSQITPSSWPHFPSSLHSPRIINAVTFENWFTERGRICYCGRQKPDM